MEPRLTAISLTMLALRSNIGGVVISLYEHSPWPVLVQATGLYTSKLERCRKVAASIASSPHCPITSCNKSETRPVCQITRERESLSRASLCFEITLKFASAIRCYVDKDMLRPFQLMCPNHRSKAQANPFAPILSTAPDIGTDKLPQCTDKLPPCMY